MTPFDWTLLGLALVLFLAQAWGFYNLLQNIHRYQRIEFSPMIFVPYILVLIVIYRVWG